MAGVADRRKSWSHETGSNLGLSGYLTVWRKPGPLKLLKKSRKWVVLDSRSCQLIYTRNSSTVPLQPSDDNCVDLVESTVSFGSDAGHFIITSHGKDTHLRADDHSTMMRWVNALQTVREQHRQKLQKLEIDIDVITSVDLSEDETDHPFSEAFLPQSVVQDIHPDHQDDGEMDDYLFGHIKSITTPEHLDSDSEDTTTEYRSSVLDPCTLLAECGGVPCNDRTPKTEKRAKEKGRSSTETKSHLSKPADVEVNSSWRHHVTPNGAQTSATSKPSLFHQGLPEATSDWPSASSGQSSQQQSELAIVSGHFNTSMELDYSSESSEGKSTAALSYTSPNEAEQQSKVGERRTRGTAHPIGERTSTHSHADKSSGGDHVHNDDRGVPETDVGDLALAGFQRTPKKRSRQDSFGGKSSTPVMISRVQAVQSMAQEGGNVEKSMLQLEQDLKAAVDLVADLKRRECAYKEMLEKQHNPSVTKEEECQQTDDLARKRKSTSYSTTPPSTTLVSQMQKEIEDLKMTADRYHQQNIIMTKELVQITDMRKSDHRKLEHQMRQCEATKLDMLRLRVSFVTSLQKSLPVRVRTTVGNEEDDTKGPGEAHCQKQLLTLLAEAHGEDQTVPTLDEHGGGSHEDILGFLHRWDDKIETYHYIAQLLKRHYRAHLPESAERQRETKWNIFLGENLWEKQKFTSKTDDLKNLITGGIPDAHRANVWRSLISLRIRKLRESKGPGYYQQLQNDKTEYARQIQVDLHRTLTTNKLFGKGSEMGKRLHRVLHAYSVHNKLVGYCQGMNMVAGLGLLILKDEEEVFWMLAAIVEKYMPPHYYDESLVGAQADQLVMKDLLKLHLPSLNNHLDVSGIDIGLVTLNWCLTIFIDVVPIRTLLRIWDCFLYEGSRALFRFSLAILYTNAVHLQHITDPISLFQHLKLVARLAFDEDDLTKIAYVSFHPFGSRRYINLQREIHVAAQKAALTKMAEAREQLRKQSHVSFERSRRQSDVKQQRSTAFECATTVAPDWVWTCEGDQTAGYVSILHLPSGRCALIDVDLQSRIMCIATVPPKHTLVGTLAGKITLFLTATGCELFTVQLNDSVLSLTTLPSGRIFAGLADGTLVIFPTFSANGHFQEVNLQAQMAVTSLLIIETTPKTTSLPAEDTSLSHHQQEAVEGAAEVDNEIVAGSRSKAIYHLWCGCGNQIIIVDAETLEEICSLEVSTNRRNIISHLQRSHHGVWSSILRTATIQLWDVNSFSCIMQIDYSSLLVRGSPFVCAQSRTEDKDTSVTSVSPRATALCVVGDHLWLGTANGYLLINQIIVTRASFESSEISGKSSQEDMQQNGAGEESSTQERDGEGRASCISGPESSLRGNVGIERENNGAERQNVEVEGENVEVGSEVRLELVQLHRVSENAVRCLAATKFHNEEVLLLCTQQKQPQLWRRSYELGGGMHWKVDELSGSQCSVDELLGLRAKPSSQRTTFETSFEVLDVREISELNLTSPEPEAHTDKEQDGVV